MSQKILDTNILIRFFTQDNKVMAERVEVLFKNAKRNELIIPDVILAEMVWVLESFYELPKIEIIEKIQALLSLDVVQINRRIIRKTIEYYENHNISYTDAYLLGFSSVEIKQGNVYSFDKGLQKIESRVIEP